jgi:hypothetical protein
MIKLSNQISLANICANSCLFFGLFLGEKVYFDML